ncbi:MAG: MFS transporter [Paracoccaceae bacterium]|nr:MFS transporter [Paracoccaceae bacterium]
MSIPKTNELNKGLFPFSVFAAVLASAGLPIYMFGPKFFAESYGVSLTALATVLFILRLIDCIQDPFLGTLSSKLGNKRPRYIMFSVMILGISMVLMFAVSPRVSPLLWFFFTSIGLFTTYSFLSINFYAQGVQKAKSINGNHKKVAAWRETGGLLGVCLAASTPTLLMGQTTHPYMIFSFIFVFVAILGWYLMRNEWTEKIESSRSPTQRVFKDPILKSLIIVSFLGAAPLAVTSSLFLFFVDSVLIATEYTGVLLVIFFLSAAVASPFWAILARRYNEKLILFIAMIISILSFCFVLFLGERDIIEFSIICMISGISVGADFTLLPALFAQRVEKISTQATQAFGVWSFVTKASLALAAIILLPILDYSGYQVGSKENSVEAIQTLTILYALVPSVLKSISLILLIRIPL